LVRLGSIASRVRKRPGEVERQSLSNFSSLTCSPLERAAEVVPTSSQLRVDLQSKSTLAQGAIYQNNVISELVSASKKE
jgi:hypothetical protein